MKLLPAVLLTSTKKLIWNLFGFDVLYWHTGLYLDLHTIPPSSKKHWQPKMNISLHGHWDAVWQNVAGDTCQQYWKHHFQGGALLLSEWSIYRQVIHLSNSLQLFLDWSQDRYIFLIGLKYALSQLRWTLMRLIFRIIPECEIFPWWYFSSNQTHRNCFSPADYGLKHWNSK